MKQSKTPVTRRRNTELAASKGRPKGKGALAKKVGAASLKTASKKNLPRADETEVNTRLPGHLYRGAHTLSDAEGLPVQVIPGNLPANPDDETELDAAYARVGVGDVEVQDDIDLLDPEDMML